MGTRVLPIEISLRTHWRVVPGTPGDTRIYQSSTYRDITQNSRASCAWHTRQHSNLPEFYLSRYHSELTGELCLAHPATLEFTRVLPVEISLRTHWRVVPGTPGNTRIYQSSTCRDITQNSRASC